MNSQQIFSKVLLPVLLGTISILIGGATGYLSTRNLDLDKDRRTLETTSYTDYISNIAKIVTLQHSGDTSSDEYKKSYLDCIDATARISIYGSARVIKAMAKFNCDSHAWISDQKSRDEFITMVAAMRSSVNSADSNNDIDQVLVVIFPEMSKANK